MFFCTDVDMYAAGAVSFRAGAAKLSENFLKVGNVSVLKYGRYHLGSVFSAHALCIYAAVTHYLPYTSLAVCRRVGVVSASFVVRSRTEIVRNNLSSSFSCDSRKLDLNAEILIFHFIYLRKLFVFVTVCDSITLFAEDSNHLTGQTFGDIFVA